MFKRTETKHQLSSSRILENERARCISFLSGSYHSVLFETRGRISPFENGMLIISIDVDVGSKELGLINQGKNDRNVSSRLSEYEVGEIEEAALPEFIELFERQEVPATFAIRGQLTEVHGSALETLAKSKVKHDIGAHGYYHRKFGNLSYDQAEAEIKMISHGMQEFGLTPKSFIFPSNSVTHLELLEKYGYECYRDYSNFLHDSMCIKKHGELWEVHPSLLIDRYTKFAFLKRILDVAIKRKLPAHLWFHVRDFGKEFNEIKRNSKKVFVPFLSYSNKKEREGVLTFETMLSAARKAHAVAMTSSNFKPNQQQENRRP